VAPTYIEMISTIQSHEPYRSLLWMPAKSLLA